MIIDTTTDPFTQVLEALWDVLEAHGGFAGMVKLGNRIKYSNGDGDPEKREAQYGDLPEVRIEPAGGGEVSYTSTGIQTTQNFLVHMVGDDLQIDAAIFPLKWHIIKAFRRASGDLDLSFVTHVRISDSDEMQDELARGARRWSGGLSISVEMYFELDELEF